MKHLLLILTVLLPPSADGACGTGGLSCSGGGWGAGFIWTDPLTQKWAGGVSPC